MLLDRAPITSITVAAVGLIFSAGCGSDSEPAADKSMPPAAPPSTAQTGVDHGGSTVAPPKRSRTAEDGPRPAKPKRDRDSSRNATTSTKPSPTTEQPPAPDPEPGADPRADPPKETKPAPRKPQFRTLAIRQQATLTLVERTGVTFHQRGPMTGTLPGELALTASLGGQGVTATFTATLADGVLRGRGDARLDISGDRSNARFAGTATLTGGSGAYRGVRAKRLRFSGTVPADGSTSVVRLGGQLELPRDG